MCRSILFGVAFMALEQSSGCLSASEVNLKDMGNHVKTRENMKHVNMSWNLLNGLIQPAWWCNSTRYISRQSLQYAVNNDIVAGITITESVYTKEHKQLSRAYILQLIISTVNNHYVICINLKIDDQPGNIALSFMWYMCFPCQRRYINTTPGIIEINFRQAAAYSLRILNCSRWWEYLAADLVQLCTYKYVVPT